MILYKKWSNGFLWKKILNYYRMFDVMYMNLYEIDRIDIMVSDIVLLLIVYMIIVVVI